MVPAQPFTASVGQVAQSVEIVLARYVHWRTRRWTDRLVVKSRTIPDRGRGRRSYRGRSGRRSTRNDLSHESPLELRVFVAEPDERNTRVDLDGRKGLHRVADGSCRPRAAGDLRGQRPRDGELASEQVGAGGQEVSREGDVERDLLADETGRRKRRRRVRQSLGRADEMRRVGDGSRTCLRGGRQGHRRADAQRG